MTELGASSRKSRLDQLSLPARLAGVIVAGTLAIFSLGGVVGFAKAWMDRGTTPSLRGLVFFAAFILAAVLFAWVAWRLSAHWRGPGQSSYERRYTRMWLMLIVLGFPAGLLLGFAGDQDGGVGTLIGTGPIEPALAVITAGVTAALLITSMVLYHRAIDDHEQQAYLWANSLAFYFLAIAIPVAWLLARGGLIPVIGIGTIMLILLAAFVVKFAVWAWLKFR